MINVLRFECCISALGLALAGCSMHPLPDNSPLNFPRASTFDIVHKVRCEAQEGLKRFKNSRHPEHVAQIINATSIGYDFKFVMIENNDATKGKLEFMGKAANPASKRSLDIDVTGHAMKDRTNTRTFRIVEDLADVARADCSPEALRANLVYPIVGRLRVDDVVYTYIRLELISDLDPNDPEFVTTPDVNVGVVGDDTKGKRGVFSEHLKFRTQLTASAMPTLTLSAVAGRFRVTNATVTDTVMRDDTHDVIIAFAQDSGLHAAEDVEIGAAKQDRARLLIRKPTPRNVLTAAVRGPRLQTAVVQANATARNKVLFELARLRNLDDDEQENPKFLGQKLLTFLRPPDEIGPGEQP
jgi:hypothetical protein